MTKSEAQFGAIKDIEEPSIPMNFVGPTAQAKHGAKVVGWPGHQPMTNLLKLKHPFTKGLSTAKKFVLTKLIHPQSLV
jgi:hypothetical protein